MQRNRKPSRQTCAVLAALLSEPLEWRHGYELAKLSGLSSGTLYPLLIRLHERRFLEAKWIEPAQPGRPARHAYRLSALGIALAREMEPAAVRRKADEGEVLS
jgi:DNA-binding PadR family transcriptional regulator